VIPSRLQETQIQPNLSGFTAIEELEELEIIINESSENDDQNSSRNAHFGQGENFNDNLQTDFYEIEAYSGDIQGEKRDGGAMVPILPWKGVHKKSSSAVNAIE